MELYKALHSVLERHGWELLERPVLVNYLADYHAFEVKATRRVLTTLLQMGYGERIFALYRQNAQDRLLKIRSYAMELIHEGYQQVHVDYVMDSICYALGWLEAPPEEPSQEIVSSSSNDRVFTVGGTEFRMIFIEGGTFDMGATPDQGMYAGFDEKPSVQTTVGNFFICETPVTQALWETVMGDNPSHFKGDRLPVERVSWEECSEFLDKLSALTGCPFRMPTEAEWEYAARGGKKSMHTRYSGADDGRRSDAMWYKENSQNSSHEVGTKVPNELGICDMSGNVSEWCSDWYFNSYASSGSRVNPSGPSFGSARVYRGGSWDDKIIACRVSKRASMNPIYKNKLVGLRLAATIL